MRDEQPLARIFPFPDLPQLPEIELPVWLEHARRIADENQGNRQARRIMHWIFWVAAFVGMALDVVGRLISDQIASWPSLTIVWVPPAMLAGLLWTIMDRKLKAATVQFGGLAQLKQLLQLYRAILRYGELRARYQQCFSRSEDERRFGLWPAYMSLVNYCLPLAEKCQPFDSHLRLAESCLNEAEQAMW